MAEYIERDKLIEHLKKDPLFDLVERYGITGVIEAAPAADVRPVIYCKDCAHYVVGELFGDMVCDYHYLHQYHAEPNEFCSHAEKREES